MTKYFTIIFAKKSFACYNNIMRVIAGKHKGLKLLSPKGEIVRPTTDKTKQAIFTKLQFFVADKVVLDLFGGSGALGIEALSRYAKQVVFCDKDKSSCNLINQNLKKVNQTAKVLNMDFKDALKSLKQKFDLILIDPPYASNFYSDCLNLIEKYELLEKDGIVVCEHNIDAKIDFAGFEVFDQKKYGTIFVTYLHKKV